MSLAESSVFPRFNDGDVLITLATSKAYQLHANVLRRNSSVFNQLLTDERATVISPKHKRDGRVLRFRVNLVLGDDETTGKFVVQDPAANKRYHDMALSTVENGKIGKSVYKHYDNLFKAFYNVRPAIDDRDITSVLQDCVELVHVAESLGSINVVAESIDIALLRQGEVLYRSIAKSPTAWSDLAYRVKSPSIFQEAVVHLVGQWQSLSADERSKLPLEVLEVCERKHEELNLVKQAVEVRILGHYTNQVQRLPSENPGRISYSNDIYMWMAMSLFRHWFSQCICEDRGRPAKDGGAALYRQIGAGGYAYLDRKVLESFHQYFPMSPKGSSCLENHLSSFKEELKPFVEDLLLNRSQMDVRKEPLPYLTCCEVVKGDMPWQKGTASDGEGVDGDALAADRPQPSISDENDEEFPANLAGIDRLH
ncbi:MAG: hypothetical protein M1838_005909 [Thelocarpon superellum]|nr:MAG: hypothetical protein M1838_005909 [Thelocarpon superellum]